MPYSITDPTSTEIAANGMLSLGVTGMGSGTGTRLFVRIKSGGELPILEDYLAAITHSAAMTTITNGQFLINSPGSSIRLNLPSFTTEYGRSHDRTFTVEVFEVGMSDPTPPAGTAPIFVETFTVTDEAFPSGDAETDTFNERTRDGERDFNNVLTAATSEDTDYDGGSGDDTYVITQYQQGDLIIGDTLGVNVIRFDYGTTITHFNEQAFGNFVVSSTITLSTDAVITINFPANNLNPEGVFNYQLGDGTLLDDPDGQGTTNPLTGYSRFRDAIGITDAIGSLTTGGVTLDYTVGAGLADQTHTTNTLSLVIDGEADASDVFGAGNDRNLELDGGSGDDIYVITRHQYGTVDIGDTLGVNIIKFDYGVNITHFNEQAFGNFVVSSTITLSTGAVITINFPANNLTDEGVFQYQLGRDEVMDDPDGLGASNPLTGYSRFRDAIGITDAIGSLTTGGVALNYTVAFPGDPELLGGNPTGMMVTEGGNLTASVANGVVVFDSDDDMDGLTFTAQHGSAATGGAATLGSDESLMTGANFGGGIGIETEYGYFYLTGMGDSGDLTRATWSYTLIDDTRLDSHGPGDTLVERIRLGVNDNGGTTPTDTIDIDITIIGAADMAADTRPMVRGTSGDDVFDATTPSTRMNSGTDAEILIGGTGEDTINTLGGDDAVLGGYGKDTINLDNNAAETVYIRFASDGNGFNLVDGGDTINSFERGVDKLVLVDTDNNTALDYAGFIANAAMDNSVNGLTVTLNIFPTGTTGFTIKMNGDQTPADGPGGTGNEGGNTITVNWDTAIMEAQFATQIGMFNEDNFGGLELRNYELFDELFGGTDYIDVVDDSTITAPLSFDI